MRGLNELFRQKHIYRMTDIPKTCWERLIITRLVLATYI